MSELKDKKKRNLLKRNKSINCPCFWRLQDAGHALSAKHRSSTWGEDGGEEHLGTSAVRNIPDLSKANALLSGDAVEIIRFEGEEVGEGADGEPVVIPTRELLRFRKENPSRKPGLAWLGLSKIKTIKDIQNSGWKSVTTRKIQ